MATKSTPAKKTAAKKTTRTSPLGLTSEDILKKDFDIESFVPPMLVAKKPEEREEGEKLVLFKKVNEDGTEEDIHILKEVPFQVSLKASRILNTEGIFAAQDFALTSVLGAENYAWLLDFPDLEQEHWDQINGMALRTVLGPLEVDGTGKSEG